MGHDHLLRHACALARAEGHGPPGAEILENVQLVLKLFWGRKRWPRRRLREAIYTRTGLCFGLYRAKVTRFAGKFREMQRLLRVKEDLQGIVGTAE